MNGAEENCKSVILASASPRRRDILDEMGVCYRVVPADVDEGAIKAVFPSVLVKKLARLKASAVAGDNPDSVVIAADTVVFCRKVYGKPHSPHNAVEMIAELNGKWHTVYTGVCVTSKQKTLVACVASRVKFKKLTERQIEKYVAECKPLDKAGAYGIQDKQIVEKYKGSYSNIVGLPKEKLSVMLGEFGVEYGND